MHILHPERGRQVNLFDFSSTESQKKSTDTHFEQLNFENKLSNSVAKKYNDLADFRHLQGIQSKFFSVEKMDSFLSRLQKILTRLKEVNKKLVKENLSSKTFLEQANQLLMTDDFNQVSMAKNLVSSLKNQNDLYKVSQVIDQHRLESKAMLNKLQEMVTVKSQAIGLKEIPLLIKEHNFNAVKSEKAIQLLE